MNRTDSAQNGIYEVTTATHASGTASYELTLESGGDVFSGKTFAGESLPTDDLVSESYVFDSNSTSWTGFGLVRVGWN